MANKMKYSGIQWIGEIPDSWELIRLKDWCLNKKEIAGEKSSNYERLALTLNGVIKRAKDDSDGLQPKEFDTYQILEANDFVFKMIDLQNINTSRVGLSPYTGLVSPAYIRFAPRQKEQFNEYIYFYLMSLYYNCVFNSMGGDGVRSALNATDMGNFKCPFPNIDIQKKIVSFLKEKSAGIDALIEVENKQIEKLKEYKQAVITEAVTKGLDKSAPMKDSGVEWIGEIPKGWSICRVKNIGSTQNGISKSGDFFGSGNPFVSYGDVYKNWELPKTGSGLVESTEKERSIFSVCRGDIFFTRTSETIEEVGFSSVCFETIENAVFAGFLIRLRPYCPENIIISNFAKYYFRANLLRKYLVKEMNIVTRASLSQELLSAMSVVLPPKNVQIEIASFLDKNCNDIDSLIEIKQKKIEKLNEYKKSLIYEYVTGKKEVL